MPLADATLYRKTALAQAELAQRKGSLAPRARMVLVMVNGVDTAARLIARLGPPAAETLAHLLSLGMIEPVEAASPPPRAAAGTPAPAVPPSAWPGTPAVTAPAAATPAHGAGPAAGASPPITPPGTTVAPTTTSSEPTPRQRATRELLRLLGPRFGPDAARIAQPALEAADAAGFNAALDSIGARLGIHLGRKAAEQLLAPLRLPG